LGSLPLGYLYLEHGQTKTKSQFWWAMLEFPVYSITNPLENPNKKMKLGV